MPKKLQTKNRKYTRSFTVFFFPIWNVFFLVFVTGDGFGLPLAIAASLHVPYRIKIGIDQLQGIQVADAAGKGKCV